MEDWMNARKLFLALVVALGCVALAGLPAWASGSPKPQLKIESIRVGSKAGPVVVRVRAGLRTKLQIWANGHRVRQPFHLTGKHAQTINLRAANGLSPGANKLRIRAERGDRASTAKRTVRVPRWILLADAGPDAGTTVKVRSQLGTQPPLGGPTGLRYSWRIAKRPKGAKATLHGRSGAQPLLHAGDPGTYVLQLETSSEEFDSPAYDQVTVPVSPPDPPIGAPINTIDGNGGITIAGQSYGGGGGGCAYVVLERTTRAVVASGHVGNDAGGIAALSAVSAKYSGDANYMKYLMIVSGRVGVPKEQAEAFAQFVKSIGVSRLGEENFLALRVGLPFSAIGIPGAPEGAGTVRIPGGDYNPPIPGAITGYLQKNQAINSDGTPLYDFVAPEHPAFDTRAAGSTDTTNNMVINGQSYSGSLPTGATAGFHVVVLESLTLRPISNQVIKTNGNGSDRAWQGEAATALKNAFEKPGGPTVFVQTIGKPKGAGPEWSGVVSALSRLGANQQLVYALDGTTGYALVDRNGSEQPPAESSDAYDHGSYPAPGNPPARLVGSLSRTRTSTFEPTVSSTPTAANPEGSVNLGLIKVAYQAPQAWPPLAPKAPDGEEAPAQKFICEALNFCQAANSCPTLRECYWQKYGSDWHAALAELGPLRYPGSGKGFGETTFEEEKAQFLKEIGAVARVQNYLAQLQAPFERSTSRSFIDLQDVGQKVWESVQRPAPSSNTPWILGLVGKLVALGGFAPPPASAIAAGLSAAFGLASYLSTPGGQPILGSAVKAEAAALGNTLYDRIELARKTIVGQGMLIVSDSGKLMDAKKEVDGAWSLPADTSAAVDSMRTASKQWFYEALVPTAYPYLIRGNATNARSFACQLGDTQLWPRQDDKMQMLATVGYDNNGTPIKAIFFFTQGIGGGSNPPASLADEMFRPRGGPSPGLGIEKLSFFSPRVFGGKITHALNNYPWCGLGWLPRYF
jgi:hypothetical protein